MVAIAAIDHIQLYASIEYIVATSVGDFIETLSQDLLKLQAPCE